MLLFKEGGEDLGNCKEDDEVDPVRTMQLRRACCNTGDNMWGAGLSDVRK
jgi:hypothetical protein